MLVEAADEDEFRTRYRPFHFDVLLLDLRLRRDREGMDVLRRVYAQDELQPVLMMSAYGDTESAIEAVGAGAMMFLHKREFSPALLARMVEAVIEQGRLRRQSRAWRQAAWAGEPETLLGNSQAVRDASATLREAAGDPEKIPVIVGERGAGASLAARVFHRHGERSDGPFVETDGARLQSSDLAADLRLSPLVQAASGTLAIDCVEHVDPEVGAALAGQLQRESASERMPRLLFLLHEEHGRRPEDMLQPAPWLQAFDVVPVRLPPLRERREDVALLATHFLQAQRAERHTPARTIGARALEILETHAWPGNARELRNAVEYAALQTAAANVAEIGVEHLPADLALSGLRETRAETAQATWDFRLHLARSELELVERAMAEMGLSRKSDLLKALGYSDRFTFGRRVTKALTDFPALPLEFPRVASLFEGRDT